MSKNSSLGLLGPAIMLAALVPWAMPAARASDCANTTTGLTPLIDMNAQRYLGQFAGGLYPDGANVPTGAHLEEGKRRAGEIQPLDTKGLPDADGRVCLLSIGMSNASQEFRAFGGEIHHDERVREDQVSLANGAYGGADATAWEDPDSPSYYVVHQLAFRGDTTEAQVQAIWLKVANRSPRYSLPVPEADAIELAAQLGNIIRALKINYPNLQMVFLSSRIYGAYTDTMQSPEPFAYESGFSVKWLIEAQIRQMRGEGINEAIGDLDYNTVAPWVAWGPYTWADGLNPRGSDGLIWECDDFEDDGTHPSASGETKVALQLKEYFLSSPFTVPWFRTAIANPGDCNGDDRFDHDDVAQYVECLSGPGQFAPADCLCADFSADSFLDLRDFAAYQIAVPIFD